MMREALGANWRRQLRPTGSASTALRRFAGGVGLVVLGVGLARLPLTWAAALVVGVAFLLGTLIDPLVGLVVVALAIPFGGAINLPIPAVNAVDLLVAWAVVCWLAQGAAARKIIFRLPPLGWPLIVFLLIAAASLTQAASWREGLPEWLKWAEFAAVYFVAAQVLDRRRRWGLVIALLAAGLLEVALGGYQFVRQAGPEAFVVLGRFMRAYGTFRQPNPYAGYLGYLMPIAISLALWAVGRWWRSRRAADLGLGLLTGGTALALGAGILMSWSRGAWLGLLAAAAAVLGLRNRRAAALTLTGTALLVAVIALAGAGWLPDSIASRLSDLGGYVVGPDAAHTEITDANFSVMERLAHWDAGLRMFADHPWLGVGIGNYGVSYARYALPHWYEPLGHAHNVFINFLAETGALGFGAFAVFWLGLAWLAARTAGKTGGSQAALAVGVLGTVIYISVHSLFDNLFVQHIQLQLALLMGVLVTDQG